MKEIKTETILRIISDIIEDFDISSLQFEDDLSNFGMDSISFIQIVVALEEEFECEIPDSKLLITELNTVQKMIETLQMLYFEHNISVNQPTL